MHSFAYASPKTKEDVVGLLAPDTAVLAGGTDLLSLIKDAVVAPRILVSIKGVEELRGISTSGDGLRIGAAVTLEELAAAAAIREHCPALEHAVRGILSPQIRGMGTVGGDLCQRPRCWYYRSGFGLLAQKNGSSMVKDGDNRYHSIFGSGPAYFVSPSSLAPALSALGAELELFGPGGARRVAVADFYRVPQREGEREYDLAEREMVVAVHLPKVLGIASATYEVRHRQVLDWPLAAAAVALRVASGRVEEARIVLGHVAPTPWRAQAAERVIVGKALDPTTAALAADAAVSDAQPLRQNAYKVQLARVATKRALLRAGGVEV